MILFLCFIITCLWHFQYYYIRDVIVDLVLGTSVVFLTDEDSTNVDEIGADVTVVIRKDVKETLLLRIACEVTTAVWNGDDITVVIWFFVAVKVSVEISETPVVWAGDGVAVVLGFDGQITAEVWTLGIVGSDDGIVALSTVIQPKSFQVLC